MLDDIFDNCYTTLLTSNQFHKKPTFYFTLDHYYIMIAYIQISNTTTRNKSQLSFQRLYRDCFPHIYGSSVSPTLLSKQYKGGDIVGAVLFPGYLNEEMYISFIDAANQQHLKFYQTIKNRTIHCYPVIAVVPFDSPIKSTQKGHLSPLKIKDDLLQRLQNKMGTSTLRALQSLSDRFSSTRMKDLSSRILTLRKEHAINFMAGIKTAEFRTNRLGDKLLSKIKTKKDVKRLLGHKKSPNKKAVSTLTKFCNKTN